MPQTKEIQIQALAKEKVKVMKKANKKKKNWIQAAHLKKGALHRDLGIPEGEKIPHKTLLKAAKESGIVGKRARTALTLEGLRK